MVYWRNTRNSVSTPLDNSIKLPANMDSDASVNGTEYRSIVGKLIGSSHRNEYSETLRILWASALYMDLHPQNWLDYQMQIGWEFRYWKVHDGLRHYAERGSNCLAKQGSNYGPVVHDGSTIYGPDGSSKRDQVAASLSLRIRHHEKEPTTPQHPVN